MKNVHSKILNNVKELVEEYSCDVSNVDYMKGTCLNCPSVSVSLDDGASSLTLSSSSESEGDFDSDSDDLELKYFQWLSIDGKANKALVSTPFDEVEAILKANIKELKLHIFVRNEQYKAYNNLKNEMPPNAMFLHADYYYYFFLSGFSVMDTDNSQDSRGREGTILFHSTTSTCSRTFRHLFATLHVR